MRDPFSPLKIEYFEKSLSKYPNITELFNKNMREVVIKGICFYELPRLYQWFLLEKNVTNKLKCINSCFGDLKKLNDENLKRRIIEFSKLTKSKENKKIFNYITEFLFITNIIRKGEKHFIYEEVLGENTCCFDINVTYDNLRLRIDVTHKTDSYPLENTVEVLKNNLSFISNKFGGEIKYAYPDTIDYNFTDVSKININHKQIKDSIKFAYQEILKRDEKCFEITLANGFFEIYIDYNINSFTGQASIELWEKAIENGFIGDSSNCSQERTVDTYFNSLSKKSEKYKKICDDSYKIIAFDINPGSYFHEGYRRQELLEKIKKFNSVNRINIDEIVTFNTRFESGMLDELNLLWNRKRNQESKLIRLLKS